MHEGHMEHLQFAFFCLKYPAFLSNPVCGALRWQDCGPGLFCRMWTETASSGDGTIVSELSLQISSGSTPRDNGPENTRGPTKGRAKVTFGHGRVKVLHQKVREDTASAHGLVLWGHLSPPFRSAGLKCQTLTSCKAAQNLLIQLRRSFRWSSCV